jgi:hypothetical protein
MVVKKGDVKLAGRMVRKETSTIAAKEVMVVAAVKEKVL